MSTPAWGGRKVTKLRQQVIAVYGRTCWLCGGEISGTVTIDHVIPKSIDPDLTWELDNLRPAHGSCNYSRGTKKAKPAAHSKPIPKPSRDW